MKKTIQVLFCLFSSQTLFSQTTANTSIFPTASGTTVTTFVGVKSTQAAGYKVSVQGALKLWGTGNTFSAANFSPTLMLDNRTVTTGRKYYLQSSNDGYFRLFDSSVAIPRFVIGNGGYIGVGIDNPSYMLDVNGQMRSAGGLHIGPLPVNYGAANINISSFMDKNSFANSVMTLSSTETGGSGTYPTQLVFAQEGASVGWSLQSVNQNVSYSNLLLNKNGGNVGIGVAPDAKLHVAGTFKLVDGTQGAGKVLTSDANGLASWTTASGGSSQWVNNGANIYFNTGNVGIGTTPTTNRLQVAGDAAFTNNVQVQGNSLQLGTSTQAGQVVMSLKQSSNINGGWNIGYTSFNSNDLYTYGVENSSYRLFTAGNERFTVSGTGNVGIGISNPAYLLDIQGGSYPAMRLGNAQITDFNGSGNVTYFTNSGGAYGIQFGTNINSLKFLVAGTERMKIAVDGSVGIGVSTIPSGYKLAVAGNIIAEKVKVQLQTAWPDYVFSPGYYLPSLREIEQFIKTNSHLPGVPSASQVEKDGIELGDNQAVLLKKIEELTLHLIELDKKVTQLAAENEALKKKSDKH